MATTLTIRLDDELNAELNRLARRTKRSKSDLAREMVRREIALAAFQRVRKRLVPRAKRAGYVTDEDVFQDIS
ncbi:CopG family ribbon-helix-helix protein [Nitrospira sp. Kam-Ns4a]